MQVNFLIGIVGAPFPPSRGAIAPLRRDGGRARPGSFQSGVGMAGVGRVTSRGERPAPHRVMRGLQHLPKGLDCTRPSNPI